VTSLGSVCLGLKRQICIKFGLDLHTGLVEDVVDANAMRLPKIQTEKVDCPFTNTDPQLLCADSVCALSKPSACFAALSKKQKDNEYVADHRLFVVTTERLEECIYSEKSSHRINGYCGDKVFDIQENLYLYELMYSDQTTRIVRRIHKPVTGSSLAYAVQQLMKGTAKNDEVYTGNVINGQLIETPYIPYMIKYYLSASNNMLLRGTCQSDLTPELLVVPDNFFLSILPKNEYYAMDVLQKSKVVLFPVIYQTSFGTVAEKDGTTVSLCAIVPGNRIKNCHVQKKYKNMPFEAKLVTSMSNDKVVVKNPPTPIVGRSLELAVEMFLHGYGKDGRVYTGSVTSNKVDPLNEGAFLLKKQFCHDNGLKIVANNEGADEIVQDIPILNFTHHNLEPRAMNNNNNQNRQNFTQQRQQQQQFTPGRITTTPPFQQKRNYIPQQQLQPVKLSKKQRKAQRNQMRDQKYAFNYQQNAPMAPYVPAPLPKTKPKAQPKQQQLQTNSTKTNQGTQIVKKLFVPTEQFTISYGDLKFTTTSRDALIISAVRNALTWYKKIPQVCIMHARAVTDILSQSDLNVNSIVDRKTAVAFLKVQTDFYPTIYKKVSEMVKQDQNTEPVEEN